ncbi:GNAT family N-acetyltransferase [Polyangium aurulentum]|uniref:GNAT family N-acetyltransferase n=1 Tax=Polyangium aurulentum TaxID=2567896 RepID=UPI0010AEBE31|nr:GNAT family N-acetyltransferase [Polyangium aurulentum]UQA62960.1 GNAT family N-acetyltransferase [Polyangium aurulentum]
MALTVLNVAYPLAPVGWDAVGGAEQILTAIDSALVRAGHRSLVIACEGSRCEGELISTPLPDGPLDEAARRQAWANHRAAMARTMERNRIDVIHLHGVDFHEYLPPPGVPALVTLHLPPAWYPAEVFDLSRPSTHLHCVSRTQRAACPPHARLLEDIPNGVPLDRLRPSKKSKEGFALVLGRVCPEKGIHLALRAAKRAGMPLRVAGRVFPYAVHERYFREEIVPLLDPDRMFLGPVGLAQKAKLLAEARCVVIPSLVPETSSLVAMEALACGTPVIAFGKGALPEVVEHGRTGFLVNDEQQLVEALENVESIDPAQCRAAAEERFSLEAMCGRYLGVYERLTRRVAAPRLEWQLVTSPRALLELREAWAALWSRCPNATVFQHPDWVLPWCEHLFSGELFTLCLRTGGRLAGVALMHRWHDGAERVLSMLGAGHSDYHDLLIEPEMAQAAKEALSAWLDAHADQWDRIEVSELRPGCPLLDLEPAGAIALVEEQDACPVLMLSADGGLEEQVPPRMAGNLRTARRRAEQMGEVSFESVRPDNLDELLDALLGLHASRWQERGDTGVLSADAVQRFHKDVARGFLGRGMLAFEVLRIDRKIVSVLYGFYDHQALRYYLGGFDPAFARASVGSLVLARAIEQALGRGVKEFDFLRGREPYKYAWGASDRPILRWRLVRNTKCGNPLETSSTDSSCRRAS